MLRILDKNAYFTTKLYIIKSIFVIHILRLQVYNVLINTIVNYNIKSMFLVRFV